VKGSVSYSAEKRSSVVLVKVSPGRSTVLGKSGWFGESGKCSVSRHRPSPCR
jgi:hypothetical protein